MSHRLRLRDYLLNLKPICTEDSVLVLVLITLFVGLFGGIAYGFTFEEVFPNYGGFEDPVFMHTEDAYAFPGEEVQILLNQSAIARHHTLRDVSVKYLGEPLLVVWKSGVDNGMISTPDNISYQDREAIKEYDGVGYISFELPDDPELYGQTITVSYKAKFRFPIITNYNTFKWGSRNISGDVRLQIGSREQEREIRNFGYQSLALGLLLVIILFSIYLLFEFRRTREL